MGLRVHSIELSKKCLFCKNEFYSFRYRFKISKFCSRKCSNKFRIGIPSWNNGLIGYKAGKNHHWFGRNVSGENNPNWKGGLKFRKKYDERNDSAYHGWVKQIKKRDKICQLKNENCDGKLVVHHIKPWRDYPELRYELTNGITLCQAHHPRKWDEEKRLIPLFMELVSVSNAII